MRSQGLGFCRFYKKFRTLSSLSKLNRTYCCITFLPWLSLSMQVRSCTHGAILERNKSVKIFFCLQYRVSQKKGSPTLVSYCARISEQMDIIFGYYETAMFQILSSIRRLKHILACRMILVKISHLFTLRIIQCKTCIENNIPLGVIRCSATPQLTMRINQLFPIVSKLLNKLKNVSTHF